MTYRFPTEDEPGSPWPILAKLRKLPELAELDAMIGMDVAVAFVMCTGDLKLAGRHALGTCGMPRVQGHYGPLFECLLEDALGYWPDFLITLDALWWETASPLQREILVFHEALHAGHATDQYGTPRFNKQTGRPVTAIRPHDLEEFDAVVARYGAWKGDIASFIAAAASHVETEPEPTSEPDADVF